MDYRCTFCHEQHSTSCGICPHCLFRSLLKDHLSNELLDNPFIQLTLDNHNLQLSLKQIKDILNDIDLGCHQNIHIPNVCDLHHSMMDTYCMNCKIIACASCMTENHTWHTYHKINNLEKLIRKYPSIECLKLDEVEPNFLEDFTKFFFQSLRYFDKLIQTVEKRKSEFIEKMKKIFDKVQLVVSVIKLVYSKFYSELKNISTSIEDLLFYNSVKLLTPAIQINYKMITTDLLEKEIIIPDVKMSFKEVKFEDLSCSDTLTGHTKSVATLLQLKDGLLASGARDGTIKIWGIENTTFTCIQTIIGHSHWVSALIQLIDGRMASASWDDTIKIWEKNLRYTQTLTGHTSSVFSLLQLTNGQIASGSRDNTIKIWDDNHMTFTCSHTLTGHSSLISVLIQLNDCLMASGSRDCTIKIWDIKRCFLCVETLSGHSKAVSSLLQLKDGRMASGSWDCTIKIWKRREGNMTCIRTLAGQIAWVVSLLQLNDGRIASGSSDYTIRIWEIRETENFQCISVLFGHSDTVNSLIQLKDERIASGSSDSTIKIWKEQPVEKMTEEGKKNSCMIF